MVNVLEFTVVRNKHVVSGIEENIGKNLFLSKCARHLESEFISESLRRPVALLFSQTKVTPIKPRVDNSSIKHKCLFCRTCTDPGRKIRDWLVFKTDGFCQ